MAQKIHNYYLGIVNYLYFFKVKKNTYTMAVCPKSFIFVPFQKEAGLYDLTRYLEAFGFPSKNPPKHSLQQHF
jgi:hypothetical protein